MRTTPDSGIKIRFIDCYKRKNQINRTQQQLFNGIGFVLSPDLFPTMKKKFASNTKSSIFAPLKAPVLSKFLE
jgi:hypothetical protein